MTTQEDLFTLYRFYAADDTLLYVGLTVNPGRRFEKHRADKPWWPQVSRIAMEQHATLELLRAAERAAIETERPVHNIRMNGVPTRATPSPADPAPALDGLVGRFFHSWRDKNDDDDHVTVKRGKVLEWQGHVVDQINDDLYLIELFSWWDGSPNGQNLVQAAAMLEWTFYDSTLEMQCALPCQELHDGKQGACGGEISHYTPNSGAAPYLLCYGCVRRYPGFRHAKPLVWRNGKPFLS